MKNGLQRFMKYGIVGVSTFAFDLLLLYVFTDFFSWNYIISTGIAFTIAISINYFFSRRFVFSGTLKSIHKGYFAFMSIACVGIIVAMLGMAILVGVFHFKFLNSRIIIAGVVGVWNYLMNLYVNFKVAGK
ncbi:MAG: GtrA family protein [bacterium]